MNLIERAIMCASEAHKNQKYDIYPYIYHLQQVANIAKNELGYDETIITSCWLHDILEDTDLSFNDIKRHFGEDVAEIVFAVTDELGRNRKERKDKTYPKIRANWKATAVKICDRVANVRQSKLFNLSMYKKYQEEYEGFVNNLASQDHPKTEITKAWGLLSVELSNL